MRVSRGVRDWPFENLFTNLTVPISFDSSGNRCFGPHSGARSTFWNLQGPLLLPATGDTQAVGGGWWGHIQTTIVGDLDVNIPETRTADREWYERIKNLEPLDLYEAQRKRRLGR